MEQAAKQIINNATEEEILPINNGETWLDLLYELELRHAPLAFDRLLEGCKNDIEYKDGNKHHITTSSGGWRTAVSNCIMRDGKHYATFRIGGQGGLCVGITRPFIRSDVLSYVDYKSKEAKNSANQWANGMWTSSWPSLLNHRFSAKWGRRLNCGMYYSSTRCFCWSDGIEPHYTGEVGHEYYEYASELGLLLDLDEGTLSVYKDGQRLGTARSVSIRAHSFINMYRSF